MHSLVLQKGRGSEPYIFWLQAPQAVLLACIDAVDWDQGLTPDVLALVAEMGGLENMKGMMGTSKTWRQGYALAVISIKLSSTDLILPSGATAGQRYPGLTSLAIGACAAPDGWLETLQYFPRLKILNLGHDRGLYGKSELASRLTNSCLDHLQIVPLTSLDLYRCSRLGGLEPLRGMPLVKLNLEGCVNLGPAALAPLLGMPLTDLSLAHSILLICDAGLERLRGLPLTSLNLKMRPCFHRISHAGLAYLEGMPLRTLNLGFAVRDLGEGLEYLGEAPLTSLSLNWCGNVSDDRLTELKGKALTHLDLGYCDRVTDASLSHLKGMPLEYLSLRNNDQLSFSWLEHLVGMPIKVLDLAQCRLLTDIGLAFLRGLPLISLDLSLCSRISAAGLEPLLHLPLTHLCIERCSGISPPVRKIVYRCVQLLRQSAQH